MDSLSRLLHSLKKGPKFKELENKNKDKDKEKSNDKEKDKDT